MNSYQTFFRRRCFGFFAGIFLLSTIAGLSQSPIFTNAAIVGGNFQVQILISSNAAFTIETSTNLTDWSAVESTMATNKLITLVDPRGTASFSREFYRLLLGTVVSFDFNFLEFANAGSFGDNDSPDTTFPVTLNSYSGVFSAVDDTDYPAATNVFFTGPGGSGLTNSPADPDNSNTNNGDQANYQSAIISSPAVGLPGTWVVNYKGSNMTFSVVDPQAASRVVVPYPTVTVSGGTLQSISWVYLNSTNGDTLGGPPAYMTSLQVQIHGSSAADELYDSAQLTPGTTSNVPTNTVTWADVSGISMAYNDILGNNYTINYAGPAAGP
ncbi:MAG TPA: hypothetical protein VGI03_03915 [Verrucomicrobiae bacterium]|jgi:hypothetical protein